MSGRSVAHEIRASTGAPAVVLRRIAGRNATKADVVVQREGEATVAVKDYADRPWLVRHTLGRWLVRREARALAAAQGLPGVPKFLGRRGPFALATTWIEARPLADVPAQELDPACADHLGTVLAALHERGIALGDLHHRDVLVDPSGGVHVVDFATAHVSGPRPGRLRRAVFERLSDQDRIALARISARVTGADPDAAVLALGPVAARHHARWRRLKRGWDMLRHRWLGPLRIALAFAVVLGLLAFARPTTSTLAWGLPCVALGAALRLWAAGHLKKTTELCIGGPYRFVRNPLYLGRLLIFTGLCIASALPRGGSWIVLALGLGVFFGYYLPRKERVEPARLEAAHGERYRRYFEEVPALIPTWRAYPREPSDRWAWDRVRRNRELWMLTGIATAVAWLLTALR